MGADYSQDTAHEITRSVFREPLSLRRRLPTVAVNPLLSRFQTSHRRKLVSEETLRATRIPKTCKVNRLVQVMLRRGEYQDYQDATIIEMNRSDDPEKRYIVVDFTERGKYPGFGPTRFKINCLGIGSNEGRTFDDIRSSMTHYGWC